MATVRVREPRNPGNTPEPAVEVAPKSDTMTVKDAKGRTLTIKKLSLLEEMNLLAAAGAERAGIARWMQYATIVSCVRKIDDNVLDLPGNLRLLNANIALVGAEGCAAVLSALAADLPPDVDDLAGDDVAGTARF